MTMRALGFVVFAGVAISLSLSTVASAQTFDHLKCYRMKDPHNFTAVAYLTPFQNPPFPVEPGCKIKVRGAEFCIPVDKVLVPGAGNAPSAPVVGQPLQNDYICYNMRCPKPSAAIPPVLVSDQFGSRTLQKFTARRICTPAIKGPPTTTLPTNPCTLDQQGTCNDTCPNAGDTCLYNSATGTCPGGLICEKDVTTSFCYCCGVLAAPCTTNADCCGGFSCIGGTCQ